MGALLGINFKILLMQAMKGRILGAMCSILETTKHQRDLAQRNSTNNHLTLLQYTTGNTLTNFINSQY